MEERKKDKIYMVGAGDHAKVVLSTLEACNVECVGIYDDNPALWGKTLWCIPILGAISTMPDTSETMAVIAMADLDTRQRIFEQFKNVCWPVFVHPFSIVHSSVHLCEGTIVLPGSIIESDAHLGKHCIIQSGCFIGHDTRLGNFCHMTPKSVVANNVKLGKKVFLGIGAVVRPYVTVVDNVTIGMGSAVVSDIDKSGMYLGVPAQMVVPQPPKD